MSVRPYGMIEMFGELRVSGSELNPGQLEILFDQHLRYMIRQEKEQQNLDPQVEAQGIQNLTATNPSLSYPQGVALDSSNNVYVADTNNNRIVKFSPNGTVIQNWTTTNPWLNSPYGVAVDSSNNGICGGKLATCKTNADCVTGCGSINSQGFGICGGVSARCTHDKDCKDLSCL